MNMIELSNISKNFTILNNRRSYLFKTFLRGYTKNCSVIYALNDINLQIKKGEAIGVIGPNGAGKSTLLRIMAGIYKPTAGILNVCGNVTSILQLGIGFLPDLSVKDNVFLFGAIMGMDRKVVHKNFGNIIDFSELNKFVNTEMKTLSLGMKERLAFSIVIHACADILILDELIAAGDQKFKEKCLNILNNFKEQGKTIIVASHDLGMIKRFCDKTLLLNKGSIVDFDKSENVTEGYIKSRI